MNAARRHPWRARKQTEKGFVLIALIALLAMGGLYFFVSNLTPETIEARRQAKTEAALMQAREALIGYALKYRDEEAGQGRPDRMYGYLLLPDLGSARNNNAGCTEEGCDAANFAGNAPNITAIGRFPWRTLGTGPLRDGHGECLWYAVSGSHQRVQQVSPMNWDTLSQLDVVVANGTAAMVSAVASAHDRPIAVIFSPGPWLAGQDRSESAVTPLDVVSECGGNYDPKNYLDLADTTTLAAIANFFPVADSASPGKPWAGRSAAIISAANKELSISGIVNRRTDNTLWANGCPLSDATSCNVVANDRGLGVTSELLFRTLRGSSYFRTDINTMLDTMALCFPASFSPSNIVGFSSPSDKNAGRFPNLTNTCYDPTTNPVETYPCFTQTGNDMTGATDTTNTDCFSDRTPPKGYFSHYKDMIFVAMPNSGTFTVNVDTTCRGVLLFANQRNSLQKRITSGVGGDINTLSNYLEGAILNNFTGLGSTFLGDTQFSALSLKGVVQSVDQDIVRCIRASNSSDPYIVASPNLTAAQQLVAYDASTRTLTLGKPGVTNSTASPTALFGCAWLPDEKSLGSGFRSYFQFSFATVGTNVGNTGFVFALIDEESHLDGSGNFTPPCGAAGSHLGYSGDNATTPKVTYPKIGIEFDQSKNAGFPTTNVGQLSTNAGRKDPCYTCGNGTTDTHTAIVYWGHENANATDAVIWPDFDDNVHGFPSAASLAATRRPPKNPDTSPGIENINLRTGGQLFHVRVEVTPTRVVNAAAENSKTTMQTKVWILADGPSVNQIAAMKDTTRPMNVLYPSFTETLSDAGAVFDVAEAACNLGACPTNQTCGSDNVCYRQGLRKPRLGFTGSQRTQDQQVTIGKMFTTWLP